MIVFRPRAGSPEEVWESAKLTIVRVAWTQRPTKNKHSKGVSTVVSGRSSSGVTSRFVGRRLIRRARGSN